MSEEWIVNSDDKLDNVIKEITKRYLEKKYIRIKMTTGQQRTLTQNNALHLYCDHLAQALNEAGYDMKKVLTKKPDIPWSMLSVKEYLWKPIQEALINKESTTEAERQEYSYVYDVLNRHLAEKFGVTVPWPTARAA